MWDEDEDFYQQNRESIDAQMKTMLRNPSERNLHRLLRRNKNNVLSKRLRETSMNEKKDV